jgi:hypothetical protein
MPAVVMEIAVVTMQTCNAMPMPVVKMIVRTRLLVLRGAGEGKKRISQVIPADTLMSSGVELAPGPCTPPEKRAMQTQLQGTIMLLLLSVGKTKRLCPGKPAAPAPVDSTRTRKLGYLKTAWKSVNWSSKCQEAKVKEANLEL